MNGGWAPASREWGECLRDRHHLDAIDVDVSWQRAAPEYRLRDILRRHWGEALAEPLLSLRVTAKADQHEIGIGQSGLNVGHTDVGTEDIGAQVQGELFHERLAGPIHIARGN